MSEAYACDRCGKTEPGSPPVALCVGDGRARSRESVTSKQQSEYIERGGPCLFHEEVDLCKACWNDLRSWMAKAGAGFDYTPKNPEDADA